MANPSSVLSEAFRLRQGVHCSLAEEDPCQGGSHKVFKIVFEDSVQWAARLCHDPSNWKYELRAVKTFQHIKQTHPDIRAPSVFFKAEHPVLYSEWVTGKSLKIWNSQLPLHRRQTLLEDLAVFLLQLWTPAVPPDFIPEQKPRYSAWHTESLDRGIRRTLTRTARWGDPIDYLIMRSMISEYGDYDKYTDVGFAHGDLNAYNIMKDDDFHLTGVVDWGWISVAPLPAVIHHPWFIADIPGWSNDGVAEAESFGEDRSYLENAIKDKEISRQLPATVSTLLQHSGRRLFFQSAFHFKSIHEKFVKIHCAPTEKNLKAANSQLSAVLSLYPELDETEGVQRIKDLLRDMCLEL